MTIQYSVERAQAPLWTHLAAIWTAFGTWRRRRRQERTERIAFAQLSNHLRRDIGLAPLPDPLVQLPLTPGDPRR
jgi:uncharacterized protein YjiS (DUF1127 family)